MRSKYLGEVLLDFIILSIFLDPTDEDLLDGQTSLLTCGLVPRSGSLGLNLSTDVQRLVKLT